MKPECPEICTEVRIVGDSAPKIAGHGALFNARSQNLGGFGRRARRLEEGESASRRSQKVGQAAMKS